MTAKERFDLMVIGGGSAGLTAAIAAGHLGAKVLLVDQQRLGGDCLHHGCVPSKALIASANTAHKLRHAQDFGLGAVEVKVDFAKVMDRIAAIQETIGESETPEALAAHGVEVAFGGARFVDARTLTVGHKRTVTAKAVIIASGSRATVPAIEGLSEVGYLDHVGLFALRELPRRLAVIGGGPIGVELGQALSRLGSQVSIIQRRPRLLKAEEPEIAEALQDALRAEGIELLLSHHPLRAERRDGAKLLVLQATEGDQAERELLCDEILVAAGRQPNVASLALDAAGVAHSARGVIVDEALRTSQRHIYAAGDCNGGPQFTHWAEHEARIAARNALYYGTKRRGSAALPRVTFCDPELASLGLSEAQARERHQLVRIYRVPMSQVDRLQCDGAPEGEIKVIVDADDLPVGVHVIGAGAGELLAQWGLAMSYQIPVRAMGQTIHAYPTRSRANRRVADEAFFNQGVSPWTTRLFGRFKPARAQSK